MMEANAMRALAFIFSVCAFACSKEEQVYQLSNKVVMTQPEQVWVGRAYHSQFDALSDVKCVQGEFRRVDSSGKLKIKLADDFNIEELGHLIGGQISLAASTSFLYGGLNGLASKAVASNEYVANRYISLSLEGPTVYIRPTSYRLSSFAQKLLSKEFEDLRRQCGDQFVSSIKLGAYLNVSIHAEFLDSKDRQTYGGGVVLQAGLPSIGLGFSAGGGAVRITEKVRQSVVIRINVEQKGGNPEELVRHLPSTISVCNLDDLEPCHLFLETLLAYAQNEFKTQFKNNSDYIVTSFEKENYADSSLAYFLPDNFSEERLKFRGLVRKIRSEINQSLQYLTRAKRVLSSYMTAIGEDRLNEVRSTKKLLSENISALRATLQMCTEDDSYSLCYDYYNDTLSTLNSYQANSLDVSFYDPFMDNKCDLMRFQAIEYGLITASESRSYQRLGWVPVIDWNDDQPIITMWTDCFSVVNEGI